MKKFLMTTAIVAGSFGAASAQDAVNLFRTAPEAMELHASDFIGMRVYREEGPAAAESYTGVQDGWDDIGEINDVIFSRQGEVEAVLVDIGGFLGMGESQVAVEMKNIRFVSEDGTDDTEDFFLVLNAPRSAFETAPVYMSDANTDMKTMPATTDTAATTTDTAMTTSREGWSPVMSADLTSEQLTGAKVYGANDEAIGEVSNIVLTADGKVDGAIVDVGGFLGMGEKPVELKLADVEIVRETDGDELRVYVSMTQEQIEALPEYQG